MKKIINGKKYDTETAKHIFCASANCAMNDFSYWEETLYQKRTGEFFLYGEGGPMTKYARHCGDNTTCGGEKIEPVTEEEAKKWLEKYSDADKYEAVFGVVSESNTDSATTIAALVSAIKRTICKRDADWIMEKMEMETENVPAEKKAAAKIATIGRCLENLYK